MDPLLNVEDLRVEFVTNEGTVQAVNGIRLKLFPGESLGLVGETGAGKTTTALSIMRLLPKTKGVKVSGSIYLNDRNLLQLREGEMYRIRGKDISMVFQDPMTSLNPVMTIDEQIKEIIEQHNQLPGQEVDQQVDEILQMVGIVASRKKSYPYEFSGGMRQRIGIAMALACKPNLLIADEPTTALDVTIQAQVLNLIRELKEKMNTSLLLITHDLGVVYETCDRMAVMYAGEIIEQGEVAEVFDLEKSHHPYTLGLFGSIPDLSTETRRLKPVLGVKPNPRELPEGCKFHPRCDHALPICAQIEPETWTTGTRQVRCHMFDPIISKNFQNPVFID